MPEDGSDLLEDSALGTVLGDGDHLNILDLVLAHADTESQHDGSSESGRENAEHPDSPSPVTGVLVARSKHCLSDVATDPNIDGSGERGENRPEDAIPQRRDIGDDNVLEQEQAGDT